MKVHVAHLVLLRTRVPIAPSMGRGKGIAYLCSRLKQHYLECP